MHILDRSLCQTNWTFFCEKNINLFCLAFLSTTKIICLLKNITGIYTKWDHSCLFDNILILIYGSTTTTFKCWHCSFKCTNGKAARQAHVSVHTAYKLLYKVINWWELISIVQFWMYARWGRPFQPTKLQH